MSYLSADIKYIAKGIYDYEFLLIAVCEVTGFVVAICHATTRPPRPSSITECLRLIARLREEQASTASWEPRPPFEAAEMD